MGKTQYTSISEINALQLTVMQFIAEWVKEKRTPVPQKEIILGMKAKNVPMSSAVNACNILMRKGYLRRAYTTSNKTYYVLLRTI